MASVCHPESLHVPRKKPLPGGNVQGQPLMTLFIELRRVYPSGITLRRKFIKPIRYNGEKNPHIFRTYRFRTE
jgi:hypothetical protein